jgi:hypothetical protein
MFPTAREIIILKLFLTLVNRDWLGEGILKENFKNKDCCSKFGTKLTGLYLWFGLANSKNL